MVSVALGASYFQRLLTWNAHMAVGGPAVPCARLASCSKPSAGLTHRLPGAALLWQGFPGAPSHLLACPAILAQAQAKQEGCFVGVPLGGGGGAGAAQVRDGAPQLLRGIPLVLEVQVCSRRFLPAGSRRQRARVPACLPDACLPPLSSLLCLQPELLVMLRVRSGCSPSLLAVYATCLYLAV